MLSRSEIIGLAGVIVALLAWISPFSSVGDSPFKKISDAPSPIRTSPPSKTPPPINEPIEATYTVRDCGCIFDSKNQLEWYIGPDRTVSWDEARAWIESLSVCGGGWQMPTIQQLDTLYDRRYTAGTGYFTGGQNWPAHIHKVFSAIGGGSWVWSNEAVNSRDAKSYNFYLGKSVQYRKDNTEYTTRVFAVRRYL